MSVLGLGLCCDTWWNSADDQFRRPGAQSLEACHTRCQWFSHLV